MSGLVSIRACCTAALFVGASASSFAYDRYPQVPIVASQDPTFLRELLLGSSTGIVRIGVFGDSQEASPEIWGRHYIMEANALLVEAFGPASETVLLQQAWWDSQPNWLAVTHNVVREPSAELEIRDDALPPGIIGQARLGPPDGADAFHAVLLPRAERCPITERIGSQWFLDGDEVVVDVMLARRIEPGTLRWRGATVAVPYPHHGASILAEGNLPGQPPNDEHVGWVTTGPLPVASAGWRQCSILGSDPDHPVDVLGIRFRNAAQSRGVVVQPLAVGGARLGDLVAEHGASGPAIKALGLRAAVLHYGANDTVEPVSSWAQRLQQAIDFIRGSQGDPEFPIIIIGDPHRRDLPRQSDYDLFPAAASAIAFANTKVIALNMRRVHEERFRWSEAMNLGLADVVHLKPHAQRMAARATIATLLETAGIPIPGCEQGRSWSECFHPLGGSCATAWPCTVLVEADARAAGRPFSPGMDCSDADGNGEADICLEAASPDINGDGVVDGGDLGIVFSHWGSQEQSADITRDGIVNGIDLGLLLIFWGPLP